MPCAHPRARLPEYHVNEQVLVLTHVESLAARRHSRARSKRRTRRCRSRIWRHIGARWRAHGLGAPSAIDGIIPHTGKGTGTGNDERIETPKVQIDEQLASLWAYFTLTRAGEASSDRCGVNMFLLRKGPDGWKIFQIAAT